jgi:hypothetical protein
MDQPTHLSRDTDVDDSRCAPPAEPSSAKNTGGEFLVTCSPPTGDAGTPSCTTPPGSLCREWRTIDSPLDERPSCAPLFRVRGIHAARHARPPRVRRIVHHYGDGYAGWPADFFQRHVRVLAPRVTPALFRTIVAPLATQLAHQENATGCTG